MMAKRSGNLKKEDIEEEMVLIDGSITDYITPSGKVYKLYYNGLYMEKKSQANSHNGYVYIGITMSNGKNKSHRVHRLVAKAFIPNPNNLPFVNHKDSNRLNCVVENLEWCNRSYNIKYSYDNNNRRAMMNWRKGASNANAKPIIQLSKESKFIKRFGCIMDAERETGILNSNIVSCLKGHQKTAGGYKWEYVI